MDKYTAENLDRWLTTPPDEYENAADETAEIAFAEYKKSPHYNRAINEDVNRQIFMAGYDACERQEEGDE